MRLRFGMAALVLALAATVAPAQDDLSMGQVRSPVLTIDPDRLLAETRFGRRLNEELRARADALAAENEQLQQRLTTEERSLTDRRPTMEVEAFRAEAEAFDQRVQQIRAEQDAKQRELEADIGSSREEFLNTVTPVLARLMIDSGAAVILERRQVFLSVGLVEITDEAITAIDEQIGDGSDLADPASNPEPSAPDGGAPRGPEAAIEAPEVAPTPGPIAGPTLEPTPGPSGD
jgi:Skp family chaperone for outer membrane proteins